MRIILTKEGQQVFVDDEDFEHLIQYTWRINDGYACRKTTVNKKAVCYRMHRVILGLGSGKQDKRMVDHINRNRLDNRKVNLRIADRALNAANSKLRCNNSSGYKGVRYISKGQRPNPWVAEIKHNRKFIHIGSFPTLEAAYDAYCNKAIELRGFV